MKQRPCPSITKDDTDHCEVGPPNQPSIKNMFYRLSYRSVEVSSFQMMAAYVKQIKNKPGQMARPCYGKHHSFSVKDV